MAHPRRVRVAVVWDPPEHPTDVARDDVEIQFHLPALEALLDRNDIADRIIVRVKDPGLAEQVRDELNGVGRGYEAYTAVDLARQTSRSFVVISRFHRAIALITLLASGIFLITFMSLKLTELRREIGALRLLGVGRRTILLTVLGVGAVVAVVGTAIGVGVGVVLVASINRYYQPLFGTQLRFAFITPGTLQVVTLAGVLVGIGAAVAVGYRLIRAHPLDQVGR
jgi:putative ABC transport system permease protein